MGLSDKCIKDGKMLLEKSIIEKKVDQISFRKHFFKNKTVSPI